MTLPKPVYETLPYVYLVVGLLSLSMLDGAMRYIPGIVLCVAGVTVIHWRISYRHEHADDFKRTAKKGQRDKKMHA